MATGIAPIYSPMDFSLRFVPPPGSGAPTPSLGHIGTREGVMCGRRFPVPPERGRNGNVAKPKMIEQAPSVPPPKSSTQSDSLSVTMSCGKGAHHHQAMLLDAAAKSARSLRVPVLATEAQVEDRWPKWRGSLPDTGGERCSGGAKEMGSTWERIKRLADHWLPKPRILLSWPERRFAVRHPRWEPYARIRPVRICAGARGNSRPYRESGWQRVKV